MIKNIFFIFLFFLFSSLAYAKEISIISDRLEIKRTDSLSIFSGNVYAIEGNLEIWSEKLTIYSSKDEKSIEEINAQDNVKIKRQELSIEGDKAKYDPINDILTVYGEVKVYQNGNIVFCNEIIVDLKNSSSIMKSNSSKRVEALIISDDTN